MEKREIDLKTARAFVLDNQLLSPSTKYKGLSGTQAVIEQLGYVQIDTISVVTRAHQHVLWTRVADYQPGYLQALEEKERLIFEYWAHAASYLPMKDYRFSLIRKRAIAEGPGHWQKRESKLMPYVLDRIRAEGPLMSKDFKKGKQKTSNEVWDVPPVNRALRQLFMEGQLMVAGRKGFQKIFDLTERVLPPDVDQSYPDEEAYFRYLIERDIRAHGLMKARDIGHLLKINRPLLKKIIQEMVEEGLLIEIQVKELETAPYYAFAQSLDSFSITKRKKRFHLLSPFDNLIIQRKRLAELFDFNYTLECYVPAPKRKVGYFSLPLLWGNDFVGQVDLKADRKQGLLIVKNLVAEKSMQPTIQLHNAFQKMLKTYMVFNGCKEVEIPKKIQEKMKLFFYQAGT